MASRLVFVTAMMSVCAAVLGSSIIDDSDTLILPMKNVSETVGIVFIQGAEIKTEAYTPLIQAVQNATALMSIYAYIPGFPLAVADPLQVKGHVEKSISAMHNAGMPATAQIFLAAHSLGGAVIQNYADQCTTCGGLLLMGAGLSRKYVNGSSNSFTLPTLTVGGTLDGLYRVTRQAETYYHYIAKAVDQDNAVDTFPLVLIEGMSHMQFASGTPPLAVKENDLKPELSYADAHALAGAAISNFLNIRVLSSPTAHAAMKTAVLATTAGIIQPIIDALKQEAFEHFERPCNTDYPMPNCPPYPHYPDKAKGTAPQVNCTCGTPFTALAQRIMGNLTQVKYITADAIHKVEDEHPHHLPHVWATCPNVTGCVLNITTVTEALYSKLDPLDTGFYSTAATELRVKMKSREAVWQAAGIPNVNFTETDVLPSICQVINEAAYNIAWANASAAAKQRFQTIGQKIVYQKDIFIGNAGPLWIWNPIEYKVKNDTLNVYSPSTHIPTNYPIKIAAGYHYCKIMSPAKVMEWIYIDGLRAHGSIKDM